MRIGEAGTKGLLSLLLGILSVYAAGETSSAYALDQSYSNKLLLTGGVSQVEGSAGGGLTPWAVIGGYGTNNEIGANLNYTYAHTRDFSLMSYGLMMGIDDRVEFSLQEQRFNVSKLRNAVIKGLGADAIGRDYIRQTIVGAKVRVLGDAILDADTWVPQVAVGVQYKKNQDGDFVTGGVIGAKRDSGVDLYASATKLILDKSLLLNGTLRFTKANQFGILGFGGGKNDNYQPELELSAAYLVSKQIAVGAEYRMKPNNLKNTVGGAVDLSEDDAYDAFIAYALNKRVSLTAAYVHLGNIANVPAIQANYGKQNAVYLSAQIGF